jgi:hypothetical protein
VSNILDDFFDTPEVRLAQGYPRPSLSYKCRVEAPGYPRGGKLPLVTFKSPPPKRRGVYRKDGNNRFEAGVLPRGSHLKVDPGSDQSPIF